MSKIAARENGNCENSKKQRVDDNKRRMHETKGLGPVDYVPTFSWSNNSTVFLLH